MLSTLTRNVGASTPRTTRCLNNHHLTTRRLLASTASSSPNLLLTSRTALSPTPLTHTSRTPGQKAYLTTTLPHLRQYEKNHDHINIKKPTSTTSSNNTAETNRGKAASIVDQDLDDPHVQQTIDSLDLDTDAELKRCHSSHDTAALLSKDADGPPEDEAIVSSTTTTTTTTATTTSVLLEDKQRSEEEFAWFVDKAYSTTTSTSEVGDDKVSSQDFTPLWKRNARGQHQKHSKHHHSKPTPTAPNKNDIDDLKDAPVAIRGLVRMLEHERARNVTVMDMRQKCDWTDWMVIAEGLSERHVGNVADEVYTAVSFFFFFFF